MTRSRTLVAVLVTAASTAVLAGCRSDGRELRAPVFPPPVTTTTTIAPATIPGDPLAPGTPVPAVS